MNDSSVAGDTEAERAVQVMTFYFCRPESSNQRRATRFEWISENLKNLCCTVSQLSERNMTDFSMTVNKQKRNDHLEQPFFHKSVYC